MNWQDLSFIEISSTVISILGILLSLISLILVYVIFAQNQKNYYKNFLEFMEDKKKKLLRYANKRKLNEDDVINYLIEDIKFFTEDFLINFEANGVLPYQQYKMLKTIYNHIKKRFLIAQKVSSRAIRRGYKNIDVRVQLFGKYNQLNADYFKGKLKNPKMKKDNLNVYATRIFAYNHHSKTFELKPRKKPVVYTMGSDLDFKKKIYFIFSTANKIDQNVEGDDLEKTYFFVACSYTNDKEKHNKKDDDEVLAKREALQAEK